MESDSDINRETAMVSWLAANGMKEIRLIAFFSGLILYMRHLRLCSALGEFGFYFLVR